MAPDYYVLLRIGHCSGIITFYSILIAVEQALIIQALAYGNKSVTLKHFQKQVVRSLGVWMGWDSGGGGGQNSTFSEHGHVAYLKENQECSNMPHGSKYFAHRHPPSPTTLGKRIKNEATW